MSALSRLQFTSKQIQKLGFLTTFPAANALLNQYVDNLVHLKLYPVHHKKISY